MVTRATRLLGLVLALGAGQVIFGPAVASAAPIGIVCTNGPNFSLRATTGTIETPDGNSVVMWSYANGLTGGNFQLPGPVLCVNQGDVVQITLKNSLSEPTSLVFPGQEGVTATGGTTGLFANEAAPGDPTGVTYTFTASQPGTYLYESGTDPAKQVEAEDWEGDSAAQLSTGLESLDERSRTIVQRRWLASPKATLHELAAEYGVSAERIRQIEATAFTRLRGLLPAPTV